MADHLLLTGCFDNREQMRREIWYRGELRQWYTADLISQIGGVLAWGTYADVPPHKWRKVQLGYEPLERAVLGAWNEPFRTRRVTIFRDGKWHDDDDYAYFTNAPAYWLPIPEMPQE